MRVRAFFAVGAVLLLAAGCPPPGTGEEDPPVPDAGTPGGWDGSVSSDAAVSGDAAVTWLDASGPDSGGAGLDAGQADAGRVWPDAGGADAGSVLPDASGPPDAAVPPDAALGPAMYPADRAHSPITAWVAAHLRAVASRDAGQDPAVLAKVGASNTVNSNFLKCFAGANVNLDGRTHLQPTLDHYKGGDAAGTTPYQRDSLAAVVGWSAWSALSGDPNAVEQEIAAIHPSVAVILFGTNDIEARDIFRYGDNMLDLADLLVDRGVIPVFTSVPPREDDATDDAWVPRYNAVSRAVAQARQVPYVDLHLGLMALPGHGMGPDGIHMDVYRQSGSARGCVLTEDGLQHGFNVRNLLTLESLHRVKTVVLDGAPPPDPPGTPLHGDGSPALPFTIPTLPFSDVRDTSTGGFRTVDRYTGCAASQDESGAEFFYRLVVERVTNVRAMVLDRGAVDVDIHLLDGRPSGEGCLARDHRVVTRTLEPGTYHFSLDTFVSAGTERSGEYILVLVEDP
jgi:hypothetical protein